MTRIDHSGRTPSPRHAAGHDRRARRHRDGLDRGAGAPPARLRPAAAGEDGGGGGPAPGPGRQALPRARRAGGLRAERARLRPARFGSDRLLPAAPLRLPYVEVFVGGRLAARSRAGGSARVRGLRARRAGGGAGKRRAAHDAGRRGDGLGRDAPTSAALIPAPCRATPATAARWRLLWTSACSSPARRRPRADLFSTAHGALRDPTRSRPVRTLSCNALVADAGLGRVRRPAQLWSNARHTRSRAAAKDEQQRAIAITCSKPQTKGITPW